MPPACVAPARGFTRNADRSAGSGPAHALELREQVDVQVAARRKDASEVTIGEVRAGVADLIGLPAVLERPLELAGRADVDAHVRRAARARTAGSRLTLGLQREAHEPPPRPTRRTRRRSLGLLAGALEVVDEQRGAVLARELFRVAPRDRELTVKAMPRPDGPTTCVPRSWSRASAQASGRRGAARSPLRDPSGAPRRRRRSLRRPARHGTSGCQRRCPARRRAPESQCRTPGRVRRHGRCPTRPRVSTTAVTMINAAIERRIPGSSIST